MADHLTARYDAAASTWGRRLAWLGFPDAYRTILARAIDLWSVPQGRIAAVDLGAGDGAFAEALLHVLGPRLSLTLVDPSTAMLRLAKARLGADRARFIAGDLRATPLPTGGYDLVTAAHLLEHLPDPDAALQHMATLLNPGGLLVLVVSRPHWCSRLVWLTWRHRRFREDEMRRLLTAAGFDEIQCLKPSHGPPRRLSLAYAARPKPNAPHRPAP